MNKMPHFEGQMTVCHDMTCLTRDDLRFLKKVLTETVIHKTKKGLNNRSSNFDYDRETRSICCINNLIERINAALDDPKTAHMDTSLFWKLDYKTCVQLKTYVNALREIYEFRLNNNRFDDKHRPGAMKDIIKHIDILLPELDHAVAAHKNRKRKYGKYD